MKRYSLLFAVALLLGAFGAPERAQAAWDWVPKVLRYEHPYRGLDATRYPGFECKLRNAWGDCVVYTYVTVNAPNKQKNYYRRVSSFENTGLNFSECQYDDYRRETSPHTYYTNCDYGEPRTYETN